MSTGVLGLSKSPILPELKTITPVNKDTLVKPKVLVNIKEPPTTITALDIIL
ncbi:hypothetical protein AXI76_gp028 [Pseudoalteromonas phage H101]|uniref:Uncharacterized protein n=1 Tax=Pseudoalteromonas phage H101 TaxID=1654919 RepID=A0A0H4IN12_9CAUD|nr:hypothetical protein AXI76_gp028 [Pseudoalteromonas phage H101]AKO60929.1 hypothetical protein [Pseudoalteromonas phage H101]